MYQLWRFAVVFSLLASAVIVGVRGQSVAIAQGGDIDPYQSFDSEGDSLPANLVDPALTDAIEFYVAATGLGYAGDCHNADEYYGGRICSYVFPQSDGTAKVLVGLYQTDARTVIIFSPSRGPWVPIAREYEDGTVDRLGSVISPLAFSDAFAPFAQLFHWHTFVLSVHTDGTASADFRSYRPCASRQDTGCDKILGHLIINGGHAAIVFDRVQGNTATGRVVATTDANALAIGAVTLTLKPYDTASLVQGGQDVVPNLCGSDALALAPSGIADCGA